MSFTLVHLRGLILIASIHLSLLLYVYVLGTELATICGYQWILSWWRSST